MDEDLRIESEPRLEDVAALGEHLYRHSAAVTGCDDGRWLAIFVMTTPGTSWRASTAGPGAAPAS